MKPDSRRKVSVARLPVSLGPGVGRVQLGRARPTCCWPHRLSLAPRRLRQVVFVSNRIGVSFSEGVLPVRSGRATVSATCPAWSLLERRLAGRLVREVRLDIAGCFDAIQVGGGPA